MNYKFIVLLLLMFISIKKAQAQDILKDMKCNNELWKYVYHPYRFQILEECLAVTGMIVAGKQEADGDTHILLKLDAGQEYLLYPFNIEKQQGCLVLETVCVSEISQESAKGICEGYVNDIPLPPIGARVLVIGTYVLDTKHSWSEIHPVSHIILIK